VLVIEDNLYNNYCNISLNSICRDLYINEPWIIEEKDRKKKDLEEAIFQKKGAKQKQNPKDKKTLNPFFLMEPFPPLADQSLSLPLAKT